MTAGRAWDDPEVLARVSDLHGRETASCGLVAGVGFTVDEDPAGVWVCERLWVRVDRFGRPVDEAEVA